MAERSVRKKNRILVLAMTAAAVLSMAGGLYAGSGSGEKQPYREVLNFFSPADPGAVYYDEATRTSISYEVEEKQEKKPVENVTKEEFDKINDAFVSEYFLDYLSDEEQKVYHQLYKGIYNFEKTINIENNVIKQDDIGEFIVLFTVSNPYVNYIGGSYTISLNKKGYVTSVNVQYSFNKEQAEKQRSELDARIDTILEGLNDDMSDYEKVKYLHDYIVTHCTYDDKAAQPYSAYGCLVQGRCVCEGYTKAMLALCDRAGINAIPVIGQAGETGSGQGHIWNMVMIDGQWCNFDVTWDDPVGDLGDGYIRYDYFGVCDDQFERTHTADKNKFVHYPSARSREADYFEVNDLICDDGRRADEAMTKAIKLAVSNGDGLARIKCTDKDAYKHALDMLFETNDGTTEMFGLLNKTLLKKDEDKVLRYSMICNDETYTITVRFEDSAV